MHPYNTVIKIRRIADIRWMILVYLPMLLLAMPVLGHSVEETAPVVKISEPMDGLELSPQDQIKSETHQQLLYMLLVAEMAASRDLPSLALPYYLQAAKNSTDPLIAQQATQWAIEFQSPEAAIMGAQLWARHAPDNLQAHLVTTTLLIGQSIQNALPYLTRALEIAPLEVNQNIVSIQSKLSEKSASHLKMALQLIAKDRPNDPYTQLAASQTSASLGDFKNANCLADKALALKSDLTPALELKAQLIRNEDDSDVRALKFLSNKVAAFGNNSELRLFYASALLDANRLDEAKTHLKLLTTDKTVGGQALIFLAEIYISHHDLQTPTSLLKQVLSYPDNRDNAQYLLGEIAEYQGKTIDAIRWYSDINPGAYQIPAILRATALLKGNQDYDRAIHLLKSASPTTLEEQKQLILTEIDVLAISKQPEDASALINEVLAKLPNDPDVLFSHALLSIRLKQWSTAEHNLTSILEADPHHADALNALGYMYSLQNERQVEAKHYISQALKISPNNPAYLDTMGWLEYRLGDNEEALTYLLKAHEYSREAEIAAHLAEVLWAVGKQTEAKLLLMQALKQNPNRDVLKEAIQRLKVNVSSEAGSKQATN
jgi:tetratricopeptide (TPR) repeat protein